MWCVYIGPTVPTTPSIERNTPSSSQVTISWRVATIAYTTENYHIDFGIGSDALTMRSGVINGSTNLTSTNLLYSATVTGLQPFTQYYYRIVATNSFTMSQTDVQTFRTTEGGEQNTYK